MSTHWPGPKDPPNWGLPNRVTILRFLEHVTDEVLDAGLQIGFHRGGGVRIKLLNHSSEDVVRIAELLGVDPNASGPMPTEFGPQQGRWAALNDGAEHDGGISVVYHTPDLTAVKSDQ